jgi:hypothetical protein
LSSSHNLSKAAFPSSTLICCCTTLQWGAPEAKAFTRRPWLRLLQPNLRNLIYLHQLLQNFFPHSQGPPRPSVRPMQLNIHNESVSRRLGPRPPAVTQPTGPQLLSSSDASKVGHFSGLFIPLITELGGNNHRFTHASLKALPGMSFAVTRAVICG